MAEYQDVDCRIYKTDSEADYYKLIYRNLRLILPGICSGEEECNGVEQFPIARDEREAVTVEAVGKCSQEIHSNQEDVFVAPRVDVFPKDVEERGQQEKSNPHLNVPCIRNGAEVQYLEYAFQPA